MNLSHPPTLDPAVDAQRGLKLASWPQGMVAVSMETQAALDGPWQAQGAPFVADSPDADARLAAMKASGDAAVAERKAVAWRILLTAEPLVHCFSTPAAPVLAQGRALSPSFIPHADIHAPGPSVWTMETQASEDAVWKRVGGTLDADSHDAEAKLEERRQWGTEKIKAGRIYAWRLLLNGAPMHYSQPTETK